MRMHLLIFTIELVEKGLLERLGPRFTRARLTEGKTSFPKRRRTPCEGLWFGRARGLDISRRMRKTPSWLARFENSAELDCAKRISIRVYISVYFG